MVVWLVDLWHYFYATILVWLMPVQPAVHVEVPRVVYEVADAPAINTVAIAGWQ
jgi:hypothetical protein